MVFFDNIFFDICLYYVFKPDPQSLLISRIKDLEKKQLKYLDENKKNDIDDKSLLDNQQLINELTNILENYEANIKPIERLRNRIGRDFKGRLGYFLLIFIIYLSNLVAQFGFIVFLLWILAKDGLMVPSYIFNDTTPDKVIYSYIARLYFISLLGQLYSAVNLVIYYGISRFSRENKVWHDEDREKKNKKKYKKKKNINIELENI